LNNWEQGGLAAISILPQPSRFKRPGAWLDWEDRGAAHGQLKEWDIRLLQITPRPSNLKPPL